MQSLLDISTLCSTLETSEHEPFANVFLSLSSNFSEFELGEYRRPTCPLSPGLIPISRPRDTLLSWKKDAVDWLLYRSSRINCKHERGLQASNFLGAQETAIFIFTWFLMGHKEVHLVGEIDGFLSLKSRSRNALIVTTVTAS